MRYYRSPRTHQERRNHDEKWLAEHGIRVRGTRKSSSLPDTYWDQPVRSREDRSWKGFRESQYR